MPKPRRNRNMTDRQTDGSVALLQQIRALKNTCPGCGEFSGDLDPLVMRGSSRPSTRNGEFIWHKSCCDAYQRAREVPNDVEFQLTSCKDFCVEYDEDLRTLIKTVLDADVDSVSGLRLKVFAAEMRDKYRRE